MSSYIAGWFCHLRGLRTLLKWWVHCWDAAAKRRESLSRWCKLLSRFNAFSRNRVVCLYRLAKTNREMLELSQQKIIFHDIDDHSFMIFTICSCSCMKFDKKCSQLARQSTKILIIIRLGTQTIRKFVIKIFVFVHFMRQCLSDMVSFDNRSIAYWWHTRQLTWTQIASNVIVIEFECLEFLGWIEMNQSFQVNACWCLKNLHVNGE